MKILSGKMVAAVTESFSSFLNPYIKADRATGLKKKKIETISNKLGDWISPWHPLLQQTQESRDKPPTSKLSPWYYNRGTDHMTVSSGIFEW